MVFEYFTTKTRRTQVFLSQVRLYFPDQVERAAAEGGAALGLGRVQRRAGRGADLHRLAVLRQVRDRILTIDINSLTPIEALNVLNDIKKVVKGK